MVMAYGKIFQVRHLHNKQSELIGSTESIKILQPRKTNLDKKEDVIKLLKSIGKYSDIVLAKKAGVTQAFVSGIRNELSKQGYDWGPTRICADGRIINVTGFKKNK